jgi:hypothetical protein
MDSATFASVQVAQSDMSLNLLTPRTTIGIPTQITPATKLEITARLDMAECSWKWG